LKKKIPNRISSAEEAKDYGLVDQVIDRPSFRQTDRSPCRLKLKGTNQKMGNILHFDFLF